MALVEAMPASHAQRSPTRVARALWHLYLMVADVNDRPRNGALFITLTEGDLFEKNFAAFNATELGSALLLERPDNAAILRDKAALALLPHGSLGRSYANFMRQAGLDEGYYSAEGEAAARRERLEPRRFWFRTRSGLTHDINHLLAGYPATPLGELCLMALRFAQLRHMGLGVLTIFLLIGAKISGERSVFRFAIEAFRRGWGTKPFEMLPWERTLHISLSRHRSWLGLTPHRHYPNPLEPDAFHSIAVDWSQKPMPVDGL